MSVHDLERRFAVGVQLDRFEIRYIALVQASSVSRITAVARPICLAGGEREPTDARRGAVGHTQPDAPGTEEGDHRGHVFGVLYKLARGPKPALADKGPAAIMRRGESPGPIVDPGPTPRYDPAPMTVAVGGPIGGQPRHHRIRRCSPRCPPYRARQSRSWKGKRNRVPRDASRRNRATGTTRQSHRLLPAG